MDYPNQEISIRDVILKIKQVIEITSLSQATIYRLLNCTQN